jgi:hypothetical protein
MCFVRISEQTATFALQNIKRLVFITEVESVCSAVRAESLYKTDSFVFKGLMYFCNKTVQMKTLKFISRLTFGLLNHAF